MLESESTTKISIIDQDQLWLETYFTNYIYVWYQVEK